jgi:hypothetical protein
MGRKRKTDDQAATLPLPPADDKQPLTPVGELIARVEARGFSLTRRYNDAGELEV